MSEHDLLFIAACWGSSLLLLMGLKVIQGVRRRQQLKAQTRDWQLKASERQQVIVYHALHAIDQRAAKGCKAGFSQGRDR